MIQQGMFTSEAVSRGHPDKLCDQISDAILDAALDRDPGARVAVETLVKDQRVVLAGELTLSRRARPLTERLCARVVRGVIRDVGYTKGLHVGFDYQDCAIDHRLGRQSADIARGVDAPDGTLGAGDQGLIFGYACDETRHLMPAPIHYAHALMRRHEQERRGEGAGLLRPDAKSQVTFRYNGWGRPAAVDTVVLSAQHRKDVSRRALHAFVLERIIRPAIPPALRRRGLEVFINPAGRFVQGGPAADCGLTGRKIIVDTYGGMARHGGGAFSGKDPSKVDRSAAYAARYVAKNIVAARLARRCEVQLAYAIGHPRPVSVRVDTFAGARALDRELSALLTAGELFDLSPAGIIGMLRLLDPERRPRYRETAEHGHFGYGGRTFPWERTDRVRALRRALGKRGA